MVKRSVTSINQNWTFKQADRKDAKFLPVAQFPTNVHLDLLANDMISDPFIGKNEVDCQWVGEATWIYRTTFATDQSLYKEPSLDTRAVLAFDGLDTFATVVLNGKEILKTENMFIPERVDVKSLLKKDEENVLEITFESAFLRGKKIVEEHPEHKWGCWNSDLGRLAVRKAQYHWVSPANRSV
jgi:beta-mannosidase